MLQGIQREPAEIFRGRIAELVRSKSVAHFVHGQRKKNTRYRQKKLDQPFLRRKHTKHCYTSCITVIAGVKYRTPKLVLALSAFSGIHYDAPGA